MSVRHVRLSGRLSGRLSVYPAALCLALVAAACRGAGDGRLPIEAPGGATPPPGTLREVLPPALVLTDAAARVPESAPVAVDDAPCGRVDRLDPPLGAPDGRGYQVRWPFGRVSNRYGGKLHAGEDWTASSGSSLGRPVYAVGHGEVVYAQPWGWGTDKGVIIVRHRFPPGQIDDDGRPLRTLLSFYGHVDPPSVAVKAGQCVVRGQVIAAVGKPRGAAHLHFEIRGHLPDTPGPGYWPTDPTRAGWRAPSAFMTTHRLRATPGVRWLAPFTPTLTAALGRAADGRLVVRTEDGVLTGISLDDGRPAWHIVVEGPVQGAALDAAGATVYVAQPSGIVAYAVDAASPAAGRATPAIRVRGVDEGPGPGRVGTTPLWRRPTTLRPAVLALPEGGVAVAADGALWAYRPDGTERWRIDGVGTVTALAASERWLVLAGAGQAGAWPVPGEADRTIVRPGLAGAPIVSGDGVFLHAPDGVTWLSLIAPEPPRVHALAIGHLEPGDGIALADGGAVVTHRGPDVRRLLRFDADGGLRWERDVAGLGPRLPRLVDTPTGLVAVDGGGGLTALDDATGNATRLFAGVGADGLADVPWAAVLDDGTVVSRVPAGDGDIVAFEIPQALARR